MPASPNSTPRTARRSRSLYLLALPYLGLLVPGLYARPGPALFGVPFFYWYQFAWVVVASIIMAFVYTRTKDAATPGPNLPRNPGPGRSQEAER